MKTTISRANNGLPKNTRGKLAPHVLFQVMKNGRTTGEIYANLGFSERLGRFFSVGKSVKKNSEGELFSTDNGKSAVAVVGHFEFQADFFRPSQVKTVTRGSLKSGDLFQVPASRQAQRTRGYKPPVYVALGSVDHDRKVLSYNINTKKLAVGVKLNGHVSKVGTASITKTQVAA